MSSSDLQAIEAKLASPCSACQGLKTTLYVQDNKQGQFIFIQCWCSVCGGSGLEQTRGMYTKRVEAQGRAPYLDGPDEPT